MDILGLLSFIFVMGLLGFFMYQTLRLMLLSNKLKDELLQANLDKDLLLTKLDQEINKVAPVDQNEGFIKFLAQSREAAFVYIEEVQKALTDFTKVVSKEIEYYKTYGMAVASPHAPIIDKIVEAYEDLVKVLPEDK